MIVIARYYLLLLSFTIHLVAIIIYIHTSRKKKRKITITHALGVNMWMRRSEIRHGNLDHESMITIIMRWNKICDRQLKWKLSVLPLYQIPTRNCVCVGIAPVNYWCLHSHNTMFNVHRVFFIYNANHQNGNLKQQTDKGYISFLLLSSHFSVSTFSNCRWKKTEIGESI